MATQLRRYVVTDGGIDEVVDFFSRIRSLRERFGFTVEFAVADRVRSEFIWAVSHPEWDSATREYEASAERAELFSGPPMPIAKRDIRMVDLIYGQSDPSNG